MNTIATLIDRHITALQTVQEKFKVLLSDMLDVLKLDPLAVKWEIPIASLPYRSTYSLTTYKHCIPLFLAEGLTLEIPNASTLLISITDELSFKEQILLKMQHSYKQETLTVDRAVKV